MVNPTLASILARFNESDSDSEDSNFYPPFQSSNIEPNPSPNQPSASSIPPIESSSQALEPSIPPLNIDPMEIDKLTNSDPLEEEEEDKTDDDMDSISTNNCESEQESVGLDSLDSHLDEEDLIKATVNSVSVSHTHLPPHLRPISPAELTVTLMQHQLVGLDWLVEQERIKNRGGILVLFFCSY